MLINHDYLNISLKWYAPTISILFYVAFMFSIKVLSLFNCHRFRFVTGPITVLNRAVKTGTIQSAHLYLCLSFLIRVPQCSHRFRYELWRTWLGGDILLAPPCYLPYETSRISVQPSILKTDIKDY